MMKHTNADLGPSMWEKSLKNRKGFIISAPSSGSGKTTLTLGLIRAFSEKRKVQPFKNGPDYIDTQFQSLSANTDSYNLDTWAMSPNQIFKIINSAGDHSLCIVEGSMGLFDGVLKGKYSFTGSTADLSRLTGWPIILVVDCAKQAQSSAALVYGFKTYRPDIQIAGVILNNVSSARHQNLLVSEITKTKVPILGIMPKSPDIEIPERHLGLVQADELNDIQEKLDKLSNFIKTNCDLDKIEMIATPIADIRKTNEISRPPAQKIGIAKDHAFTFTYSHLLNSWKNQGAEITTFSPLNDEPPPTHVDFIWLPGGYPELHLKIISSAEKFKKGIYNFSKRKPVHGECGGYMVMGSNIIGSDKKNYRMAGIFNLSTSFEKRKLNLGYRVATIQDPFFGFKKRDILLGHEFHYTSILEKKDPSIVSVEDAYGNDLGLLGSRRDCATGTFFHLIGSFE